MLEYEDATKIAIETLKSFDVTPTVAKENEYVYVFTIPDDRFIGGPVPLVIYKENAYITNMTGCVMDGYYSDRVEIEF